MFTILFYEDAKGDCPVLDLLKELAASTGKDSRVRLKKIQDYINILAEYGTQAGVPYMKHLEGDLWEIRPLRDRIFFAGAVNGKFVLLHHFVKKTQKTPKREIEQAERELKHFIEQGGFDDDEEEV